MKLRTRANPLAAAISAPADNQASHLGEQGLPRLSDTRRKWLAGLLGGIAMAFSLPPWGAWPLAFIGFIGLDYAIAEASIRQRFKRGWLCGAGLLVPSTVWMFDFTPPGYFIQWIAYSAFLGVAMALCPSGRWRRLALPGAWVVFEAVKGRWPFGGVPLSDLAIGQVAGPLGPFARIAGTLGVALLTAVIGTALAAGAARAFRPAALAAGIALFGLIGGFVLPHGQDTGKSVRVAYVQGGGQQHTTDEETDDREVFLAHLNATRDAIEPGSVDLIMWPENVVNVEGPLTSTPEGGELAELAIKLKTPIVAGVVESSGSDHFTNASVVFGPSGRVEARYDKVRRVPFGEFVPFRSTLESIAGGGLPPRDAIAGTKSNTIDTTAGRLGVVISWEVFFGDRGRDAVNGRGDQAEWLANPTNGSSYWGTLVQTQQLNSSRLRAIETGRWEVQCAPTGFSAFVSPSGQIHQRSSISERRVEVRGIPLRHGHTLYARLGAWPPFLLALACIAIAQGLARREISRRSLSPQTTV